MSAPNPQLPSGPGPLHLVQGRALRPTDAMAAERMLRAYVNDPQAMAALRLRLAVEGRNVTRLTDDVVVTELARRLANGQWHLSMTRRPHDHWLPGRADRRVEAAPSTPRSRPAPRDEKTHVLVAEIRTIGGTLLCNHPVRVLDPDTGKVVVDDIDTDGKGVLRTRVPDDKTYRIEILDEAWDDLLHPFVSDDTSTILACRFVDEHGEPVADSAVEVTTADRTFAIETDAEGYVRYPAEAGVYELRLRGETFRAHTLLPSDLASDADGDGEPDAADPEAHYLFVVPAEPGADTDSEGDESAHRLERDDWFDGLDEDRGWSDTEAVA